MNRNYAQAAAELGCTESWLRENTPKLPLPHLKFGIRGSHGPVVFTDEHLDQIRRMFSVLAPESTTPTALRPVARLRRSA